MICRFIILICTVFFTFTANAEVINKIIVQGNERIEEDTVKSYLNIIPGIDFTKDDLDSSIKKLYASNLFQRIDLTSKNNILYIKLIENPKINLIVFEGNSKVKSKDLESEISLKTRSIYTKAKVQEDVNRIIDLYHKNGRFSAKVIPQIISLPQNRVDLIYKIEEGPIAKIGKIIIVGNKAFSDRSIEAELSSKETQWYYFLSNSDLFNPVRLEYDRELLTRFYHSKGYADFKITSIITNISEKKERFYITITLDEGAKYHFDKIDLASELKDNNLDLEALRNEITTKPKDIYDVRKIEKSVDLMIKQINNKGYAFVDVGPEIRLDQENKLADIIYHIGESKKVYINKINIKGNVRTADKVIRREFRLSEGDPYNSTKIDRSEQRINNLDFFERTNIETTRSEDPDKVDLNIDLQEKSTSSITLSAGYDTSNGMIGKIGFNEPNLLGNGQQLDLMFAKSQYTLDAGLGITEPYLFDMPLSGGFNIFTRNIESNKDQYRRYDQKSVGFSLNAGYDITEYLHHNVYYGFTKDKISNVKEDANSSIENGEYSTSMIGHKVSYDKLDSIVDPTEGYYLEAKQDLAGIGGSTKFLRHIVKGRYYQPVIKDDIILVLSSEAGIINGLNGQDININDRFFLGGDDLRGFDYGGVGPRNKTNNDALGGNIYYRNSAEVKFPLGFGKEMGFFGSFFIDSGSVYNVDNPNNSPIWDSKKMRSSYGAGIGFATPMGPIRVYYAEPITKTDHDKTRHFDVSFKTKF